MNNQPGGQDGQRQHQSGAKAMNRWIVYLLFALSMALAVTVTSCEEQFAASAPVSVMLTATMWDPTPSLRPSSTVEAQASFAPPSPSTSATPDRGEILVYDRLDPFFRQFHDEAMQSETLDLHLCFWQSPSEDVLHSIDMQVINTQLTGPIAVPMQTPCWAVRVNLLPQSVPAITRIEGLYKVVLVEPAPEADYLAKLGGIARFLAEYRPNSESLEVFVHMAKEVNQSRIEELEELGLILYPQSWIPPLGAHTTGYYIGQAKIADIVQLAKLGDIVRITSAERELGPNAGPN